MLALQNIPAFMNRSEQGQLIEHVGGLQVALIPGDFVQLIEAVVHPAVFYR
ncbi:hypothetical protein D3C71_2023370 [compost metagenome]